MLGTAWIQQKESCGRSTSLPTSTSGGSARWWLSTRYVIECKSGTAPWVLFTNDEVVFTKDENVLELMETRFKDAQKSDLRGIHKVPALSWHRPVAYQIADTGGGNQAAYPAVREVMSAVDGVLSDPVMGYGSQGAVIVIPVVVTRAPIVRGETRF